jgi:hypothetical protein
MEGGNVTGNSADELFNVDDSEAEISGVTITDNASLVFSVDNGSEKVTLTECVLGNNNPTKYDVDVIVDTVGTLVMIDCTLGDTTFEDKQYVDFGKGAGEGSMIGEGSFTNILIIISMAGSVASICLTIGLYKKKTSLATAGADTDEE